MRALLRVDRENHERDIVLLGEELERRCVFERVYLIGLGEFFGQGFFEEVEVCESQFEDTADFGALEEESGLRVLDDVRLFLLKLPLRARGLRFAV